MGKFLRIFIGTFGVFNLWLCFYHWITEGSIRSMIMEAAFGIIFYITFLFVEDEGEDDDDYYDDSDGFTNS